MKRDEMNSNDQKRTFIVKHDELNTSLNIGEMRRELGYLNNDDKSVIITSYIERPNNNTGGANAIKRIEEVSIELKKMGFKEIRSAVSIVKSNDARLNTTKVFINNSKGEIK